MDRKLIQEVFLRTARDSKYQMDPYEVAKFTGKLLSIHPLQVWTALGYMDTMISVAKGEHPICNG